MAKTSIQRRLLVTIVFAQLLLAIGLVDVAVFVTRSRLRDAFDVALQGRAMSIAALVRYGEGHPHPLLFESGLVPPPLDPAAPDLYEVFANEHNSDCPFVKLAEKKQGLAAARRPVDRKLRRSMGSRIEHCAWNTSLYSTAKKVRLRRNT